MTKNKDRYKIGEADKQSIFEGSQFRIKVYGDLKESNKVGLVYEVTKRSEAEARKLAKKIVKFLNDEEKTNGTR